jgi:hypothetical protein
MYGLIKENVFSHYNLFTRKPIYKCKKGEIYELYFCDKNRYKIRVQCTETNLAIIENINKNRLYVFSSLEEAQKIAMLM